MREVVTMAQVSVSGNNTFQKHSYEYDMNLTLEQYSALATLVALVLSFVVIAVQLWRFLGIKKAEQSDIRFRTYHTLVKIVSKGADADGPLKLVSQIAYIHEFKLFPEYRSITETVLGLLSKEWEDSSENPERKKALTRAISETLAALR